MKQFIVPGLVLLLLGCDSNTSVAVTEQGSNATDNRSERSVNSSKANSIETIYVNTCRVCHDAGIAGAPKIGDPLAWQSREAKGMDNLILSVKNGLGAMPPGGLCPQCSDEELKALIDYMINPN